MGEWWMLCERKSVNGEWMKKIEDSHGKPQKLYRNLPERHIQKFLTCLHTICKDLMIPFAMQRLLKVTSDMFRNCRTNSSGFFFY